MAEPTNDWWDRWLKLRDLLLFFAGMAGVVYETLEGAQIDLLILFGGMIGVPIFLPGGIKVEFSHQTDKTDTRARVDLSHPHRHEDHDG